MRLYISETVCGCTRMAVVATLGVALALAANSMIQQRTTPSVGFEALVFREGPKATWTDHWGNAFIGGPPMLYLKPAVTLNTWSQ